MAALKIKTEVLTILDRARLEGNALTLPEQLDRKTYVDVAKIIEAAGGKWNRKAAAHVFDGPAIEAIEPILLTGEVHRCKQDFGQFDTPEPIVDRLIELAQIKPGMDVLEPSAGIGNIIAGIIRAGAVPHAFEIDDKRRAILESRSACKMTFPCAKGDFLSFAATERVFDRVVMNPPFANQADIDHVLHAAKFVKRGGRLVSVMSPGFTFREDRKSVAFRAFLDQHGASIIYLPENSFKESGTSVNTVIVTFNVD